MLTRIRTSSECVVALDDTEDVHWEVEDEGDEYSHGSHVWED